LCDVPIEPKQPNIIAKLHRSILAPLFVAAQVPEDRFHFQLTQFTANCLSQLGLNGQNVDFLPHGHKRRTGQSLHHFKRNLLRPFSVSICLAGLLLPLQEGVELERILAEQS
jgi:hypothetical protein